MGGARRGGDASFLRGGASRAVLSLDRTLHRIGIALLLLSERSLLSCSSEHEVLAAIQLAEVRFALGVPGPDVPTATRFRDKGVMKDTLRAAGIPTARHRRLRSAEDGWSFADEVGYPLVLKPPAGSALLFGGEVTHAGRRVESGTRCMFVASFSVHHHT